ncbi:MAG: hypothetical protein IT529_20010 [Burkholderiales bacterium]|nr:hypothetical protein [Burkholderiales bacterium]
MSQSNPYQPPRVEVADVAKGSELGTFIEGGRAVEAGQGWAWIVSGFGIFRIRPGAWIVITIILGVLFIVVGMVPVLGWLANMLLMPVFIGGLLLGCKTTREGGDFGVGDLFAGFRNRPGRLAVVGALGIVGSILVMIPLVLVMGKSLFAMMGGDPSTIVAMGPVVLLGFLLALALSVPLYMALWFAPALVVFREIEPVAALRQSFGACLKNIAPFLLYGVVVLILTFLAAIPFGLGFLVLGPVLIGSIYAAYRDVFHAPS